MDKTSSAIATSRILLHGLILILAQALSRKFFLQTEQEFCFSIGIGHNHSPDNESSCFAALGYERTIPGNIFRPFHTPSGYTHIGLRCLLWLKGEGSVFQNSNNDCCLPSSHRALIVGGTIGWYIRSIIKIKQKCLVRNASAHHMVLIQLSTDTHGILVRGMIGKDSEGQSLNSRRQET